MTSIFSYQPHTHHTFSVAITLIIAIAIGLVGCGEQEPIKIGFSGCLTGKLSDLGISGRNGVMLAVEQINQAGGIQGRMIELVIRDDQHHAETAIQVDQELIKTGVTAIIGHMTSAMSLAALPTINAANMVMISPTSTSNDLSGLDDYFFRTGLSDKIQSEHLADYAFEQMGVTRMSLIYDDSNYAFTELWSRNFQLAFEHKGGTILQVDSFTSGKDVSYTDVAQRILSSEPEAVLIVAGALDTAMICQQLRKRDSTIPFLSSGWAKTPDLIQQGGSTVEGLVLPQTHDEHNTEERYVLFVRQFRERFGNDPNFAAAGSYDSAQLLFNALRNQGRSDDLKQTMLKQPVIQGLQGEISIDRHGDAHRQTFLFMVTQGQFVTIQ